MERYQGLVDEEARRPRLRCNRGHELTEENSYVVPGRGWRECRICRLARRAKWYDKNRRRLHPGRKKRARRGTAPPYSMLDPYMVQ